MTRRSATCVFASCALLALSACDSGLGLSVEVRTDLSPGNEFATIVTSLVGEGVEAQRGTEGDFVRGVRAADFEELEPNAARLVRVELRNAAGVVVLQREVLVNHDIDRAFAVVLARDCVGVACGEMDSTCHGGDCVDNRCINGTEPSCPEPECRRDADCPPQDACADAQCVDGLCFYPPAGVCDEAFYCDPLRGCLPAMTPFDGGPMDAGPMDAGPAPDASPGDAGPDSGPGDAGPSDGGNDDAGALGRPRLTWPPSGAYTGIWTRSPRFNWQPVTGAEAYEVEADDSCTKDQTIGCAYPSPEMDIRVSETQAFPTEDLLADPGLPFGTRYRWRVRACNGGGCGPWSADRYMEVGRSGTDVDGDGRNDLIVGAADIIYRFEYESGPRTFVLQETLSSPLLPGGRFGFGIDRGDYDGDGFADVAIGAPQRGEFVVAYGSGGGLTRLTSLALAGAFLRGTCSADFDGDGFTDLAMGTVDMTLVHRGSATGLSTETDVVRMGVLETCGDVDNDGYADLMTTAGTYKGDPDDTLATALTATSYRSPRLVGDINADGLRDAIGGIAGEAEFIPGTLEGLGVAESLMSPTGLLNNEWQMVARGNIDRFGTGHGNLAVFADLDANARSGAVRFIRGDTNVDVLAASCSCTALGRAIIHGMDLNGDTMPDLAVSAVDEVHVYFGAPGGFALLPQIIPPPAGATLFGVAL